MGLLFFIFIYFGLQADNQELRESILGKIIYQGLNTLHFQPLKIDDAFSEKVFQEYLNTVDASKRFLIQSDIDQIKKYRDELDEEFASAEFKLKEIITPILSERIQMINDYCNDILKRSFDYSIDESLEFDGKKREYAQNQQQLKDYWRKTLKYYALIQYVNNKKNNKNKKSDAQLEEESRKSVAKSFKSIFTQIQQTSTKDSLTLFLDSIIRVYDPHSEYFPPIEKENFNMEMSGSLEGIGALLGQDDGYVKIVRIIPGGPSWNQKDLQAEDLILKVGQGEEEPVDIVGMRTVDAVKLIRGKKGTTVQLTIKKPDGRILTIKIVRDMVILEETFVKSAIINDNKLKKSFGFIYIPKFYNDFHQKNGRNCTEDVKKEIEKLKEKKVAGIILDLRNNSGGTLSDAVNISGLFVPQGPIVQVKGRDMDARILNDPIAGVVYDGSLVVMVNILSASAAEILAAALQDYQRAVIVGGKHSYGKGTVQMMIELDQYLTDPPKEMEALGAMKITVQKFYRVTGASNQYQGVIPDIILPDGTDYLDIGEKFLDYSLKSDSIAPVKFEKWNAQEFDLKKLIDKSTERVNENEFFKNLKAYILILQTRKDKSIQNLKLDIYEKEQKQLEDDSSIISKAQKDIPGLAIASTQNFTPTLTSKLKEIAIQNQTDWFNQLKKDQQLAEAINILNDMNEKK